MSMRVSFEDQLTKGLLGKRENKKTKMEWKRNERMTGKVDVKEMK